MLSGYGKGGNQRRPSRILFVRVTPPAERMESCVLCVGRDFSFTAIPAIRPVLSPHETNDDGRASGRAAPAVSLLLFWDLSPPSFFLGHLSPGLLPLVDDIDPGIVSSHPSSSSLPMLPSSLSVYFPSHPSCFNPVADERDRLPFPSRAVFSPFYYCSQSSNPRSRQVLVSEIGPTSHV